MVRALGEASCHTEDSHLTQRRVPHVEKSVYNANLATLWMDNLENLTSSLSYAIRYLKFKLTSDSNILQHLESETSKQIAPEFLEL